MSGYLSIGFIEEKVRDLENALFYSLSDALLKIPTSLVKIHETDELGQLWFVLPKPTQSIHAFEHSFPVKLDFFRKGRDFYLKVFGKAFLVNDPEEINGANCIDEPIRQQARNNEILLVRIWVSHAEYSEKLTEMQSPKNVLHQVKNKLYRWFQLSNPKAAFFADSVPVQIKYPNLNSFPN